MSDAIAAAFVDQAKRHLTQDFLPKIRRCVETLSEEEVWRRGNENTNSIGNLILHLCGNVRQWIISGVGGHPDTRRRPLEFAERGPIAREELIQKLEQTLEEAVGILDSVDARSLLQPRRIQRYDVTGVQAIFHVVEHFSYHTGQIIYITRLLKNVDLKFYRL